MADSVGADDRSGSSGDVVLTASPPASLDRVFVHALNTVKKMPKTGASRPPTSERLRLYGLYKQAMEGDVDGVMEQPTAAGAAGMSMSSDELQRERDKWDAWNAQKGLSRTESKRRYVEALIETMHKYANTADGLELVAELEFVWNQIKDTVPSSASSRRRRSDDQSPMKILSPMSEMDEVERRRMHLDDEEGDEEGRAGGTRWQRTMERALTKLSAEVAALREQIATGREWRWKKERSASAWLKWLAWLMLKHLIVDSVVLCIILFWMRRRKDRRLEDLVRAALQIVREYVRAVLPSR